jgi:putative phosphoribosyl transferase
MSVRDVRRPHRARPTARVPETTRSRTALPLAYPVACPRGRPHRAAPSRNRGGFVAPFRFTDREDAGVVLARMLAGLVQPPCVVLGVPRGGVIVALPVALRLNAPLGIAFARRITVPTAPEYAVGAVDEDGDPIVDHAIVRELGVSDAVLARARWDAFAELERERREYAAPSFRAELPRCTVVVVDDGMATGLTARATVAWLRRHSARQVIVAAPCASDAAATWLVREADRFVCPVIERRFAAVSPYYDAFPAVTDAEVMECLARARTPLTEPGRPTRRRGAITI